MTNESCTRREGVEGQVVAKRKKRDKRNREGRKNMRTADGNKDGGLRRMDDIGGWSKQVEAGAAGGKIAGFETD